jgi:hypothetical protein
LLEGNPKYRLIPLALVAVFTPAAFSLYEGQINILIFAGMVGFLFFEKKQKYFLAGIFASLLTIKPHILYLVCFVIVLWFLKDWKFRFVAGFLLPIIIFLTAGLLLNPRILDLYIQGVRSTPPSAILNTSFYAGLVILTGKQSTWMVLLPMVVSASIFGWYYLKVHNYWNWMEHITVPIICSIISIPYAWIHDEILFIIPLLYIVYKMIKFDYLKLVKLIFLAAYLVLNIVSLKLIPLYRFEAYYLLWFPVSLIVLYVVATAVLPKSILPKADSGRARHPGSNGMQT